MKKIIILFILTPAILFASSGRTDNNTGHGLGTGKCETNPACNKVSNLSRPSDNNQSDGIGTIAIAAVAGVAIVGALWWLFRAKPSANFNGHARLASF